MWIVARCQVLVVCRQLVVGSDVSTEREVLSISTADFRFSACKQTHVKRDPKRPLTEHVLCPLQPTSLFTASSCYS